MRESGDRVPWSPPVARRRKGVTQLPTISIREIVTLR
jgi:hypothetical protein